MKAPSILIVDDEEQNRALLRAMLGANHRSSRPPTGPSPQAARDGAHRPGAARRDDAGHDRIRGLQTNEGASGEPYMPVLLVTALSEQEQEPRLQAARTTS